MERREVDVAIVGAGTAGLNARRAVEKAGQRPLLIESGPYGTLCARVGCMPSKLLIAAADAAHAARAAGRFGVRVAGVSIDGPAVLERVRRLRDRFVAGTVRSTERLPADQRLRGRARFAGPTTLEVGGRVRVEARAVVLATGSVPRVPEIFAGVRDRIQVSDDVFEWKDLPESVAVVGAGVVGLELGQALHRLGVRVAVFNRSREVGIATDPAVQERCREIFAEELDLRLGVELLGARRAGEGLCLRFRDADGVEREEDFGEILVAAGREPDLAGLELGRAGLALGADGAPAWDATTGQCGDAPIFLAGDASGHRAVLHEAADEGRIAGENAARFPDVEAHERRTSLVVVFSHPQLARVGRAHAELEPGSFAVGEVGFEDQGRARVMGENRGLLRIYARRGDCRLLGAEMVGPRVEHLAHLLAWAVQRGQTVQSALAMPFYHPVVEEGVRTALRGLADSLGVRGECRGEDWSRATGV